MKALTTRMLVSIATRLFRTVAAMIAPCSVKASGNTLENLSFWRWSHFATTSSASTFVNCRKCVSEMCVSHDFPPFLYCSHKSTALLSAAFDLCKCPRALRWRVRASESGEMCVSHDFLHFLCCSLQSAALLSEAFDLCRGPRIFRSSGRG